MLSRFCRDFGPIDNVLAKPNWQFICIITIKHIKLNFNLILHSIIVNTLNGFTYYILTIGVTLTFLLISAQTGVSFLVLLGVFVNVMYNCRSWNIHDSSSLFNFLSISLPSVSLWIFSNYLKCVDLLYIHVCVPYHLKVFPRYTTLHNGFEPVTKWKLFTTHGLLNWKERGGDWWLF